MLVVLSGCATTQLPANTGSNTVLVIPKSVKNETSDRWARRYRLVISKYQDITDKSSKIKVVKEVDLSRDDNTYLLIDDLPPGNYAIDEIAKNLNSGWRSRGAKLDNRFKVFYPFTLKEGEVALLNNRVTVRQYRGSKGTSVRTSYNFKEISEEYKESVLSELKLNSQFSSWKVSDVPAVKMRSMEDVRITLMENRGELYAQYNKDKINNPGLKGKLTLSFDIAPNGQVVDLKVVYSDFSGIELESKLVKMFKGVDFGVKDVRSQKVKWTYNFYPE